MNNNARTHSEAFCIVAVTQYSIRISDGCPLAFTVSLDAVLDGILLLLCKFDRLLAFLRKRGNCRLLVFFLFLFLFLLLLLLLLF